MSYEQCENIKAIVGISICSIALLILIIKNVKFAIDDKRYKEELRVEREMRAALKEKKLENLKLETISLNLTISEIEMLDELCDLSKSSRNEYLRGFIKHIK